ncbi:hypothetical protein C6A88_24465 [Mycolicibacterium austroafricanum]|nr:hypothetical protein C6A88_24465 [Mycolicibacterium austroafricanum]
MMNFNVLQRSVRARWIWIVSITAVSAAAVLVAGWLAAEPDSPERKADCVIVAETVRRWQTAVAALTPIQGATGPSDEYVDEQYTQMATMVQTAADSVTTPEIKSYLTDWAAAADRLAMSQLDVSGGAEPPETPEEMLEVFTPINDAAGALGELCPDMPSAE